MTILSDPNGYHFTGHGAHVWSAALSLAECLAREKIAAGTRVLELGAGCGLPGLVMARTHGASVTLTDVPWLLPLLRVNVDEKFDDSEHSRPTVATLRWGSTTDVEALSTQPDIVIGSDIIYEAAEV